MKTLERKMVPMIAVTIASLLSAIGSASAVTIPRPIPPIKGCICRGRYLPPKICQVIRCAQELNSITSSEQAGLDQPLGSSQLSPISTDNNNFIAGRYRTRGPGSGISRNADSNHK
ncbi:hypothetical protein QUB80_05425 [Chlorogloeopsis sp. ULAP01]|uniref:hypothetical protein n=1 Tax=Chlorogloeopsis sp. ULAP01 TaxID=3056483 RepID=UPI0025AA6E76|nr:hypothetical protein [Chlorogloeopsis sp. ULAP01]MDM9380139.1 hypothetical protein [Chlorogloeopsis sp. ULAP01]